MKIPAELNLDFGLVWAAHNLIRGRMLCRTGLLCATPIRQSSAANANDSGSIIMLLMSAYDPVDGSSTGT